VFEQNFGDDYSKGKNIFLNTFSLGNMFSFIKEILNYKEEGSVMGLSSYKENKTDFLKLFHENKFIFPIIWRPYQGVALFLVSFLIVLSWF